MPIYHKQFQHLLYHKFIFLKHYAVAEIAHHMGISPQSLYAYCEGERTFPPDLLPSLFIATQDIDVLVFCLKGTGYTLAPLPLPGPAACLKSETLDVAAAAGELAASVNAALANGGLDHREFETLQHKLTTVEREAEEVRSVLCQLHADTYHSASLRRDPL